MAAVSIGNSEKGYTRQITNVAAGTLDTDAVNVAQLKALNDKVTDGTLSSGKNITIHTTTDANGVKKNTIDLNDNITFGSDTDVANEVKVDGTKGQVVIGDAKNGGIVIGNQDNGQGTTGHYVTGLDNTKWDKDNIVEDRAATEGQLKDISESINNISNTVGSGTREFVGDSGSKVSVKLGESMNLKGGAAGELSDGNIGVVTNSNKDGFDIKLAKDLKDLNSVTSNTVTTKELTVSEKANIGNVSISKDNVTIGTGDSKTVITNESLTTGSVTTGNTTINNGGLTIKNEDSSKNITVENNNVSMGGNRIQNVGDAQASTDAINKGQFDSTISNINSGMTEMNGRIGSLDRRVDRVGAGAAALAALHPLDYDPTSRWEISAGVGNYKGANAVALGAFYRLNYDTMVSIGSSYGGGENMVNAGVTLRIGQGETRTYSSQDAVSQELNNLKSVVEQQNRKLEDQSNQIAAQNNKIESQSEQLTAQNNKIAAQDRKIEAQSQQLETQNQKIENLTAAVEALSKTK